MSPSVLLFGVLPLIVFVVIDSFAGLKAGIISAVLFACLETAYSIIVYKRIDSLTYITIGSLAFVAVFGWLSVKTDNPLFFKMQPVVLGIVFGFALLIMQMMDKPFFVLALEKYQYIVPEELRERMKDPFMQVVFSKLSLYMGWGLLAHAGAVAYAALSLSNWWWLAIRGVGLYAMMGAIVLFVRFSVR